jgi:sialidase-1
MNRWCFAGIAWVSCFIPVLADEPFLEKVDLFEAGKDGYALFRIPGIVVTKNGAVLAYCEARKNAGGDWGHIDLVFRRSSDGGKTWQPRKHLVRFDAKFERNPAALKQKLGKDGEITLNNPVAIVDRKSGAVHFLVCVEYGRCFYLRSDDDGKTFTKPAEITATFDKFKKEYDWKVLATGPGHGIQLVNGRLIVPVWLSTGAGGHAHRPSCVAVIYSDDHGKTWQRGDIVVRDPDLVNPSESVAVQLYDGRVMLNIRHEGKPHFRAVSFSRDGATKWTKPKLDDGLPEPVCMASMTQIPMTSTPDVKRLLFANPNNPTGRERKNLSVRLSYDDGGAWKYTKTLEAGPSGYSDLAIAQDGTILCFYERGAVEKNMYRTRWLTVARFNFEWLTDGKDMPRFKKH